MHVQATLMSPDFREAYVLRQAEIFNLPEEKSTVLAEELAKPWQESFVFLLGVACHDRRHNDFDKKDSVWRMFLTGDGKKQASPSQIVRQRPITATHRKLFPSLGPFHMVYHVHFPKSYPDGTSVVDDSTQRLELKFNGPLGQGVLVWRVR